MSCARSAISKGLFALAVAALAGCGVVRPSDFPATCVSYEQTIRPMVEFNCSECHGNSRAEGGYVVGEYRNVVSRRPDGTPRVAPGESDTLFLKAVRGELDGHGALTSDEIKTLSAWVIGCRAAPGEYQNHPQGWATPTDTSVLPDGGMQFHGKALRQEFYRFTSCQKCHGEDLRGGGSGVDCGSCHTFEQGQLACNTCHGDATSAAPPKDLGGVSVTTAVTVGAHRKHLTASATHRAFGCADCHVDVKKLEDQGHYRTDGVFHIDRTTGAFLPAKVSLQSGPGGAAKWDRTTATCTNSACHAPSTTDVATSKRDPVWTKTGEIGCGSCHGAPPSTHAAGATNCQFCHGPGYANGAVDVSTHLNGRIDLKGDVSRCDSCHAGPDSPSFVDLQGRTADAGVRTVGAHDAHLHASRLRGPLTCNECHVVPSTLHAPGHLDDGPPADVFAAGFTGLAANQPIVAVYDATNATCTNTCHSGGDTGPVDTATGLHRTPSWTGGPSEAACGTCHGLPPVDGTIGHVAAMTTSCNTCHSRTVSADGGIVFSQLPDGGVTSTHIDGKVEGQ